MRTLLVIGLALGVAGLGAEARGDQVALDFTDGSPFLPANEASLGPYTLGWSFTTSQSFLATGLGFWDEGGHPLGFAHDVGLWDSSQNLLASTTITSGSTPVASTGPGQWLFDAIGPVSLAPGTYYLGADYVPTDNLDAYRYNTLVTTMPGLSFDQGQYVLRSPGLTFPGSVEGDPGTYLGPNIELSAVPEPASVGMLIGGVVTVLLARRWRRRGGMVTSA